MKISCLQQDLLPAIQSVSRSVGVKVTLPVLANILIQTESGKLKLTATNLEVATVKKINVNVVEDGEISIPAKTFVEIVSSLPSGEIEIEGDQNQIKLTSSKFRASLNGVPASEFPVIPLAGEGGFFIDAALLKRALPEITFAAATDEGRPILTGILMEIKQGFLELVATDGFRLSHKRVPVENAESFKALIPRKTFEEIVRIIDEDLKNTGKGSEEDKQKIKLSTTENQNQIVFEIGQTLLSSRLIEGQFPAWEKIIPVKFENRTIVDRQDFLKAVKVAAVFARDAASIIKIQTGENKLNLTSETRELGSQESEVEAQVEGQPITIAFNSRFLVDALSNTSSSQVSIEFSGNLSAALIKPLGDEGLEYIVMPVRVS